MKLTLYYYESCPYCRKVIRFMEKHHLAVEMKDILIEDSAYDELKKMGGKTQVPCLFIDERPVYESDDIIQWLKKNIVEKETQNHV